MAVLVVTGERDRSYNRIVRALDARAVEVVRIDTAWFPQQMILDADHLSDPRILGPPN
ncbi:MAG: hypothetical protein ACRDTG_04805 [Pseudonocardiaceae bacterium]